MLFATGDPVGRFPIPDVPTPDIDLSGVVSMLVRLGNALYDAWLTVFSNLFHKITIDLSFLFPKQPEIYEIFGYPSIGKLFPELFSAWVNSDGIFTFTVLDVFLGMVWALLIFRIVKWFTDIVL